MRKTVTAAGCLATGVLALVGCGGSSGSSKTSTRSGASPAAPVSLPGKINKVKVQDVSAKGTSATLAIEADDFYFGPSFVKAAPGATLTVQVKNEGHTNHTFTIDGGGVDQQLQPGQRATVTVAVPRTGFLRFSCRFHGSMGMQGAFFTGRGAASSSGVTGSTSTSSSSGGGY